MGLSNELISQFAKLANENKTAKTETTAYGTAKIQNGTVYVQIDGSELLTPVDTAVDVKENERVIVSVKDHTITVTGNTSSPAARVETVKEQGKKLDEFDIIVSYKVAADELTAVNATITNLKAITAKYEDMTAVNAKIETLEATYANLTHANLTYVNATDMNVINAEIESLTALLLESTSISTEDLEAAKAEIGNLQAHNANFTYVSTEILKAYKADIEDLGVKKLDVTWANIDTSNIDIARIGELFSKSGIIGDLTTDTGTVTGTLVGVTIIGDDIKANTIKADKLVVKGSDGIYYKLNFEAGKFTEGESVPTDSLHGSVITAKSITAEKVSVSDLVAFGATIGGFKLEKDSIHSVNKDSVNNVTRGIYLDNNGQVNIGDENNYLKLFEDSDGSYKLIISASSILYNLNGSTEPIETAIENVQNTADEASSNTSDNTSSINKLNNNISSLITDEHNNSLMIQNEDGSWTFNMSEIQNSVSNLSEEVNKVSESLGVASADISNLLSLVKDLGLMSEYVVIDTYEGEPCIFLGEHDSDFRLLITNTRILFLDGNAIPAYINNKSMFIKKAVIEEELSIGKFIWKERANGNVGLIWKEVVE